MNLHVITWSFCVSTHYKSAFRIMWKSRGGEDEGGGYKVEKKHVNFVNAFPRDKSNHVTYSHPFSLFHFFLLLNVILWRTAITVNADTRSIVKLVGERAKERDFVRACVYIFLIHLLSYKKNTWKYGGENDRDKIEIKRIPSDDYNI